MFKSVPVGLNPAVNLVNACEELEAHNYDIVEFVQVGDQFVIQYKKRLGRPPKGANEPRETR